MYRLFLKNIFEFFKSLFLIMLFLFFIFIIILLFYIAYFSFKIYDTIPYILSDIGVLYKVFISYQDCLINVVVNNKPLSIKLLDHNALAIINKTPFSPSSVSDKVSFQDLCRYYLDKDSYIWVSNPVFTVDINGNIVINEFLVDYMEDIVSEFIECMYKYLKILFNCFVCRNLSYYFFKVNEDSCRKMCTDCKILQTLVNYIKRSRVFLFFIVFYRFFFFKDFSLSYLYPRRYHYMISWAKYFILCYIEFFIGLIVFSFYIIYLFYSLDYYIMKSVLSCIFTKPGFICLVLLLLLICILILYFIFLYFILLLYSLKTVKPLSTLRKIFKRL